MKQLIVRFSRDEGGQDLIEYALIGSFVSLLTYAGANMLGGNLNLWYTGVAGWVAGATGQLPPVP